MMEILDRLVLFPTADHLPMLDYLILLMLVVLFPFLGMLISHGAVSLVFHSGRPSLARDLVNLSVGNPAAWFVLGLLPLLSLLLLYSQYLYGAPIIVGAYISRILGMSIIGFLLLFAYQRTLHPLAGLPGVLLLLGVAFHLSSSLDLVAYPEKWESIRTPLPFLFSIQVLLHFLILLTAALAVAGAAILFMLFQWPERKLQCNEADRPLLMGLGFGMLLAGALLTPPLILLDLYTAPAVGLTPRVFIAGVLMLVILLVVTILTVAMIRDRRARFGWQVFILSVLVLGLFAFKQQTFQGEAIREHEMLMAAEAGTLRDELVAQREALYASAQPADERLGERIFQERCTACHDFKRRVVGPPYEEVLSKYVDDLEALTTFIANPKRINTAYPTMPNQGLRRREVEAVATYLLQRFTGSTDTEAGQENPVQEEHGH
jgi:cytochrome c